MLGIETIQKAPLVPPRETPPSTWPTLNPGNPLGIAGGARRVVVVVDATALRQAVMEHSRQALSIAARSGLGTGSAPGHRPLGSSAPRAYTRARSRLRISEQAWRHANQEKLRALAGEWIVLEGEELIAHGSDPARLVTEARAKGVRVPYIFFVETAGEDVARIGL